MNTQDQKIQALKQFPLLQGFADAELEALETILEYRSLQPGEILFHEGDMSNEIYFIPDGLVEICKAGSTGQECFVVATREGGELVGELAFLDGAPRSALVRAAEETEVIILDKRQLIQLPYSLMFFNRLISNIALVSSEQLRTSTERHVKSLENQLATVRLQNEFGQFFIYILAVMAIGMLVNNLLHTHLKFISIYSLTFMIVYTVILLLPSGLILWKLKIPLNTMGMTLKNWKKSLYEGIIASLIFIGFFTIAVVVVKRFDLMPLKPFSLSAALLPWYMPPFYFLHSATQELFGRGFLQTSFQRFFNDRRGTKSIFLASLLFGLFHIHFGILAVVITFISSLIFGAIYARHQNIIGVSLLHYIAGVCAFVTGVL